jgi:hypothetical protein
MHTFAENLDRSILTVFIRYWKLARSSSIKDQDAPLISLLLADVLNGVIKKYRIRCCIYQCSQMRFLIRKAGWASTEMWSGKFMMSAKCISVKQEKKQRYPSSFAESKAKKISYGSLGWLYQ